MGRLDPAANRVALRAAIVSQMLSVLGPKREADAEWMAEQALKYHDILIAAAHDVPQFDPKTLMPSALLALVGGHMQGVVETAFLLLLMATKQALALTPREAARQ